MDRQCSSCGGFCRKSGCERKNVQSEQEPVAVWELQEGGWDTIADPDWMETLPIGTKLYTAPPQREWVGLTDEEAKKTFENHNCTISADLAGILARAIKKALKDKNK